MALINSNHPCDGKNCNECESCIFDADLFVTPKNTRNMENCTSCHDCEKLIKNYIGDEKVKFTACCGRYNVRYETCTRPRVIKENTGPMLTLTPPSWCPQNRGILTTSVSYTLIKDELENESQKEDKKETSTYMTYSEKRERMMALPKHLKWDEITEGGIYVIPKIMHQKRKVIKVVLKTDSMLRFSEIDEDGDESSVLKTVYPQDIDAVFITKLLKF